MNKDYFTIVHNAVEETRMANSIAVVSIDSCPSYQSGSVYGQKPGAIVEFTVKSLVHNEKQAKSLLGVKNGNIFYNLQVGEVSVKRWRNDLCDWHKEADMTSYYRFLKLAIPYECKFIDSPVSVFSIRINCG